MKAERLFRAIGLVDEGLIEAAAETPAKKRPVWRRYAVAAACLMVLCGAGAAYLITGGFRGYGASAGGSGINNAGGAADAVTFMSYAGPVLPLTTAEETPGVTAERHTDWDFTPRTDPEGYDSQWGAGMETLLGELDECIPDHRGPEQAAEERVLAECVSAFLRGQTADNRYIFLRRYWYGEDIAAIAKRLDCGESRVKSVLFRTRKALRAFLEKEGITV